MPKINVTGLAESDGVIFKTRPAGQYPAVISGVELTETKADSKHPGSPMLKITLKLPAYEDNDACSVIHHIILPNDSYMDAEQMRKKRAELKRLCVAIGLGNSDDFETEEMLDQNLIVVLSEETPKEGPYAGKTQNRVTDFLSM